MTTSRVLLVDDEPSVLNALGRLLSADYTILKCASGQEALRIIGDSVPFPVVITDMRMPKMDGIQFIQAARAKSPDSVYIMLTGNQDQATAIQALNDGNVFRFLTKPCQSVDLKKSIEAGLRQYQLVTGEKELLQKTFVGAVSVLTDVLELSHPGIFGRAERIQEIVGILQNRLRMESQWEYKLAARLGLLGFALLPEHERVRFEMVLDSSRELQETIGAAAAIGSRIIERIPRLGVVAQIIGMMGEVDGEMLISKMRTEAERIVTGATLLRVAIQWDFLIRQGLTPDTAVDEMRETLPNLPLTVATILAEQDVIDIPCGGVECNAAELVEGMILQDDVLTSDGMILIRRGRRLTWTIIEKLRSYERSVVNLRAIHVKGNSAPAKEPLLA